ncbi:MAG: hypothetical protein ABI175_20755, partial [Polyangiales bacterium]
MNAEAPAAHGTRWMLALAVAACIFLPLLSSAFFFLRMPPLGTPIAQLGWTPTNISDPEVVVVEADGAHAWIVSLPYIDEGQQRILSACRVVLATGSGNCRALMQVSVQDGVTALHHAVGKGGILLVLQTRGPDASAPAVRRAAFASTDGT